MNRKDIFRAFLRTNQKAIFIVQTRKKNDFLFIKIVAFLVRSTPSIVLVLKNTIADFILEFIVSVGHYDTWFHFSENVVFVESLDYRV